MKKLILFTNAASLGLLPAPYRIDLKDMMQSLQINSGVMFCQSTNNRGGNDRFLSFLESINISTDPCLENYHTGSSRVSAGMEDLQIALSYEQHLADFWGEFDSTQSGFEIILMSLSPGVVMLEQKISAHLTSVCYNVDYKMSLLTNKPIWDRMDMAHDFDHVYDANQFVMLRGHDET